MGHAESARRVVLGLALAALLGACDVADQSTHESTYFESVSACFTPQGITDHNPVRRLLGRARPSQATPWPSVDFQSDASGLRRRDGRAIPIDAVLPARADGAFHVTDTASRISISARVVDAAPIDAEITRDALVYRGALGHASDILLRPSDHGLEDYVVLRGDDAASAPTHVDYEVSLDTVAGLRLVDDTLEVLDAGGAPRLRVNRPYLTTARGRRLSAALTVEGCAVDVIRARPGAGLRFRPVPRCAACACRGAAPTTRRSSIRFGHRPPR